MFYNLNAEMGRAKLTIKKLSEISGINYESLKLKLRGVTEFKLCEMVAIKKRVFPDKTLDYLFATDSDKKESAQKDSRYREVREIRSFEVDIDKGILKINGQDVDTPTIVTLPGPEGWPLQRLFASSTDAPVECKRIDVVLNNKP